MTSFHMNLEVYVGLERYVESASVSESETQRTLHITAEHDCKRLHCALRDLASLLQALGRLADHFIGHNFTASFHDAYVLVDRSLHTSVHLSVCDAMNTCVIVTSAMRLVTLQPVCCFL